MNVFRKDIKMNIAYNNSIKNLPNDQLKNLFVSANWCDANDFSYTDVFNQPFINSTLVISAWENEKLIGVVRVLSDKIIRSVIYDFVVLPEYQNKGIGKELIRRCIEHYPKSEWLVGTEQQTISYYEKLGFTLHEAVLTIPSTL